MSEQNISSIFSRQRLLLEFSTLFYFVSKNSVIPLAQEYIYALVANKHNYTRFVGGPTETCGVASAEEAIVRHTVNRESSLIVLYLNIAELLPSAIIVLFLGCWSDWSGRRKFLMWLPCLGNAIYALGFIIPTYAFGPKYSSTAIVIMVTATIISGLSGNIPGFLAGNASYISDTDSRQRRTLRLAIVEFTIGITYGLSNLGLGYWIHAAGFMPSFWFVLVCSLIPFFFIFLLLNEPETDTLVRDRNPTIEDIRSIRHICSCGTLSQRKMWAVFFAFQIYVFVQQGQERTYVLFLQNYPLCWASVNIGLFLFTVYFLSGLGSWPAVPLLNRCVGDVALFLFAILSKALGSILLGFATTPALVYLGKLFSVLQREFCWLMCGSIGVWLLSTDFFPVSFQLAEWKKTIKCFSIVAYFRRCHPSVSSGAVRCWSLARFATGRNGWARWGMTMTIKFQ